jgi:hypothetical protein
VGQSSFKPACCAAGGEDVEVAGSAARTTTHLLLLHAGNGPLLKARGERVWLKACGTTNRQSNQLRKPDLDP